MKVIPLCDMSNILNYNNCKYFVKKVFLLIHVLILLNIVILQGLSRKFKFLMYKMCTIRFRSVISQYLFTILYTH